MCLLGCLLFFHSNETEASEGFFVFVLDGGRQNVSNFITVNMIPGVFSLKGVRTVAYSL